VSGMRELEGKVAIVTGASSGIGLAVARRLVAEGASVALVARTKSKLDEAVRELGDRAAAYPLDVKDTAALGSLPEQVAERFGGLDILVNNAGLNHRGSVLRTGTRESALPRLSGTLATVGYLFPAVARGLRPLLERRGAANKRAYLARKGR
jgi:NAD(P)-dependent dehydrogenase (short-subunit alcohol dehydrogenase family)